LQKNLEKEVQQGWVVPLPLSYISCLRHVELASIGMDDKQWTELPDRTKQIKHRLTHDQSFNTTQGQCVNDRVLPEKLEPLYYGGCLSRIIHYILSVRQRPPSVKILFLGANQILKLLIEGLYCMEIQQKKAPSCMGIWDLPVYG
jgi:hypothetical protein